MNEQMSYAPSDEDDEEEDDDENGGDDDADGDAVRTTVEIEPQLRVRKFGSGHAPSPFFLTQQTTAAERRRARSPGKNG